MQCVRANEQRANKEKIQKRLRKHSAKKDAVNAITFAAPKKEIKKSRSDGNRNGTVPNSAMNTIGTKTDMVEYHTMDKCYSIILHLKNQDKREGMKK